MSKSSGRSLMPILLILMAALFFRFISSDSEVEDMKKMRSKLKSINSQTTTMINAAMDTNSDHTKGPVNAGNTYLDVAYKVISETINNNKDISLTAHQREILTLGAHYLVFEYAMTKGRYDYCNRHGVDISDYFPIFYRENKDIRSALRNFLNVYNFVALLKKTVNTTLDNETVKNAINSFVIHDFAETSEQNGKSDFDNCKILPMGDLVFGDKFTFSIMYKNKYAYNYQQLIGE